MLAPDFAAATGGDPREAVISALADDLASILVERGAVLAEVLLSAPKGYIGPDDQIKDVVYGFALQWARDLKKAALAENAPTHSRAAFRYWAFQRQKREDAKMRCMIIGLAEH